MNFLDRKKILLILSGIPQVDKALVSLVQGTCILNNKIELNKNLDFLVTNFITKLLGK